MFVVQYVPFSYILTHIFMCAVTYNVHTQIINYTLSLPYQTSCGLLCQFMFNWTDWIQAVKTVCVCVCICVYAKKLHFNWKICRKIEGKRWWGSRERGECPHFSSAPDFCIKYTHTLPLSVPILWAYVPNRNTWELFKEAVWLVKGRMERTGWEREKCLGEGMAGQMLEHSIATQSCILSLFVLMYRIQPDHTLYEILF